MRKPLIISALLHLAILVAVMVGLPMVQELPPVQSRVLPVELVTNITEKTNLLHKAPTPIDEPKPVEPEKEKVAEQVAQPEPKPQPEEKTEPLPEPQKEQPKPQPEPEKKAEVKKEEQKPEKKPEPPKKEEKPKKKQFDPNQLAKLLNKLPDDSAPKQKTKSAEVKDDTSPTTDDPNAQLSLSEMDAFRQQMEKCWSPPIGAPGNEDLSVKIRVYLNQDGTLSQAPEYENQMKLMAGSPYYRASAEAAMRAIRRCAPYKMPADRYSGWKELLLNFDPRDMLGG